MCHAVRAPGANVTLMTLVGLGVGTIPSCSIHTVPVNHSSGPGVFLLVLSSLMFIVANTNDHRSNSTQRPQPAR